MKDLSNIKELIVRAVEDLNEERVMKLVDKALNSGLETLALLELIKEGVKGVGKKYENQQYFIADLIMAGLIFKEVLEMDKVKQQFQNTNNVKAGKLLIGTVAGDLHDIGKDIFKGMMEANGFETIDLGVDVKKEEFVKNALEFQPDIIGLSGVLTFTVKTMKDIVDALTEAGIRNDVKVILGGNHLTKETCDYISADAYATDASIGVKLCKKLLSIS